MIPTEREFLLKQEIVNDWKRDAKQRRLVKRAVSPRQKHAPFYTLALTWLRRQGTDLWFRAQLGYDLMMVRIRCPECAS